MMKLGTSNKLLKFCIDILNEASPGLFHTCPYKTVNVSRAALKIPNVGSVFPSGDYRVTIVQTEVNDKFMFKMNFAGTINSADKNSFG